MLARPSFIAVRMSSTRSGDNSATSLKTACPLWTLRVPSNGEGSTMSDNCSSNSAISSSFGTVRSYRARHVDHDGLVQRGWVNEVRSRSSEPACVIVTHPQFVVAWGAEEPSPKARLVVVVDADQAGGAERLE